MTYDFNVVAVGVENESAVIIGMILGSQAGRPVISAACGNGRLMKRIDHRSCASAKRNVYPRFIRRALTDPRIGLGRFPEAGDIRLALTAVANSSSSL